MKYLVAALIGLALIGTSVAAQDVFYRLNNVTEPEHAVQCGKNGGKGAWVFDLDAEGNAVSEMTAVCLTPVK